MLRAWPELVINPVWSGLGVPAHSRFNKWFLQPGRH